MDTNIVQLLIVSMLTFGIVYITIPVLIKIAYLRDLYDKPDGVRKVHANYIPALGGVAIFIAFFVGYSLTGFAGDFTGFPYLVAAMILLFFTGLKDDLIGLSPGKKLAVELIAVGLLIFGSNVFINNFFGIFGVEQLPFWGSILITVFTVIVVMNAYNLIDGVDGLAGSIGFIASAFFGIGFYIAGSIEMAALSYILAVSLAGFLVFNYRPASIFMGDTGSLTVGFLLSVMAVKFIGLSEVPAYTELFGQSSPILPAAILIVPLYDTIRVFYRRAKRKKSPFMPGSDHIHHELMRMGFGHTGIALTLSACTIFVTLLAVSLSSLNPNIILISVIAISLLIFPTNGTKRRILSTVGIDLRVGANKLDVVNVSNESKEKVSESKTAEPVS